MKYNTSRASLKFLMTASDEIVEFGVGGGAVVDIGMIKHATIEATTAYLVLCAEGVELLEWYGCLSMWK